MTLNLNDTMEFDHVIRVHADGTVTDADADVYAPEVLDDNGDTATVADPWRLMTGYTGQYGYNGPVMHPSEFIGGKLEQDILSTPGLYVVVEVRAEDGSFPEGTPIGWAIAYQHEDVCTCGHPRTANYHLSRVAVREVFDGAGTETEDDDTYWCDEHLPTRETQQAELNGTGWQLVEWTVTELR